MTPLTDLSTEVLGAYERFCPSVLSEVIHEVVRAEKLHGPLPTNHDRVSNIAGEEMGEVCEATLDYARALVADNAAQMSTVINDLRRHLREEWVQLAAVAFRAIENLDKEGRSGSDS